MRVENTAPNCVQHKNVKHLGLVNCNTFRMLKWGESWAIQSKLLYHSKKFNIIFSSNLRKKRQIIFYCLLLKIRKYSVYERVLAS